MATNYTVGQAFDIINEGTDMEAIADIARRFPLVTVYSAKLSPVAKAASEFLNSLPDYMTARKVEKGLRNGAGVTEFADEDTNTETDEAEEAEKPAPKKRGRKAKAEQEPQEEESKEESKHAGKNAMELFKECKKRGIKCQPKKPAKFYIDLLEKADAEGAEQSGDDDDDWDI